MKSKICCWRVVSFRSAIRVLSPVRTCVRNCKEGVGRHQAHLGERARLYTRRPARACGGTGRRARLRAWSCNCGVEVRILSGACSEGCPREGQPSVVLSANYELALPPLRPAAAFCFFEPPPPPPPEEPPPPEFLPPLLEAAFPEPALALEIFAARSFDMPFLRRPSYWLSFLTEEP